MRFYKLVILLVFACFGTAQADGLITTKPTILYDGPSVKALKKFILSGHHPLRQVVRLAGFQKVKSYQGDQGWIVEADLKKALYVVVTSDNAGVYADPNNQTTPIFYAKRGVVLKVIKESIGNYIQIVHADGESGYVIDSDVWRNY